jgi:hypothetical protein
MPTLNPEGRELRVMFPPHATAFEKIQIFCGGSTPYDVPQDVC